MTVFDRLEAQLLDAHPHWARRALPRPAARHVLAFAATVAAVIVVAVAGLAGGSSTSSQRPAAQPGANVPAVVRAKVTVSILGGTRHIMTVLDTAKALKLHGWKIGTVGDYTDPNLDSSCVDFTPGYSAAASLIAKQLGIHNVLPVTRLAGALAGPKANVVVIVGRDRFR